MHIPSWLNTLAKDSYLNSRDVASIFGIPVNTLRMMVAQGQFPKPHHSAIRGEKLKQTMQWSVDQIVDYIRSLK